MRSTAWVMALVALLGSAVSGAARAQEPKRIRAGGTEASGRPAGSQDPPKRIRGGEAKDTVRMVARVEMNGAINSILISNDGKKALVEVKTGETGPIHLVQQVRIVDLEARKPVGTLQFGYNPQAISADGRRALAGTNVVAGGGGGVAVWDITLNRTLLEIPRAPIQVAALAADGRTVLVTGSVDGLPVARIFDVETKRERLQLEHQRPITRAALSADGKLALTADAQTLYLWDLEAEAERWRQELASPVRKAAFPPDGRRVLVVQADPADRGLGLRALSVENGEQLAKTVVPFGDRIDMVQQCNITSNGAFAAFFGGTREVTILETAGLTAITGLQAQKRSAVGLSGDGRTLAVAPSSARALEVWQLPARPASP